MYNFAVFSKTVHQSKLRLLQMHFESGVGHIGGNLSSLDILLTLYHQVLKTNDVFILSKGHSAGALYIALWSLGRLSDADLKQFHKDGTKLSGHPPLQGIPEILFATGSLGHGLGLATGVALGKKLKGEPGRVFCLLSDGEWNEGSNWEALIMLTQYKLENLTFIVDANGLQGFGSTREVANLEPFAEKFRTFGVATQEVNGHDLEALYTALTQSENEAVSHAIVAHTKKGCGVSFMANKMEWHYLPMTEAQYQQAIFEINQVYQVSVHSNRC